MASVPVDSMPCSTDASILEEEERKKLGRKEKEGKEGEGKNEKEEEQKEEEEEKEEEKYPIFSYGSNSLVQLRARVHNPCLQARPAIVRDHVRIFVGRSRGWGNQGVGSLYPHEGGEVKGAVVVLTKKELGRLNAFEGGYTRTPMKALVKKTSPKHGKEKEMEKKKENAEEEKKEGNGKEKEEWEEMAVSAYIANCPLWEVGPSEQYLCAIHVMLREQFPDEYHLPAPSSSTPPSSTITTSSTPTPTITTSTTSTIASTSTTTTTTLPAATTTTDTTFTTTRLEPGHIRVKGVFQRRKSPGVSDDTENTQGMTKQQQEGEYSLTTMYDWRHPCFPSLAPALSLEGLMIELNTHRSTPHVMPASIALWTTKLQRVGVTSSSHLFLLMLVLHQRKATGTSSTSSSEKCENLQSLMKRMLKSLRLQGFHPSVGGLPADEGMLAMLNEEGGGDWEGGMGGGMKEGEGEGEEEGGGGEEEEWEEDEEVFIDEELEAVVAALMDGLDSHSVFSYIRRELQLHAY